MRGERGHAGQVRLAGRGRAADHDHGPPSCAPREPPRQLGEVACLRERPGTISRRELAGAKACHLRAHPCAIGGVKKSSARPPWSPPADSYSEIRVPARSSAPDRDQVHHEECQIRGHVDAAQRGIELDRVEDLDRVPLEDHVLGAQVAVAVAHEAACGPVLDLLMASVQERDPEAVSRREALWRRARPRMAGACRSSR